jgi:hypothetical protein
MYHHDYLARASFFREGVGEFWLKRRIGGAAAVILAVFLLGPVTADAQSPVFRAGAGLTAQQFASRAVFAPPQFSASGFASPFAALANSSLAATNPYASLVSNPYGAGAYSPYGYGYWEDPAGAYLKGAAQVINSQGQLMVNQMNAFSLKEQVRAARTANLRRALDEYLYERERTPTGEDEVRRLRADQLQHSRNNPSPTEIWSAKALNELLDNLRKYAKSDAGSAQSFPLPLDEDALKRINLTSTKSSNNVGLLKNEGRLTWPLALTGPAFATERERLSTLAQKAVQQAQFNNQVDPGTVKQMQRDLDALQTELRKGSGDLTPALYMDAKTFVNNLDDAIKALRQADIASYFNGKYALKYSGDNALKGRTVPDLVKYMVEHGLQFAPATPGDEASYAALHQALAAYDMASHAAVER